jgi:hypothetical protein
MLAQRDEARIAGGFGKGRAQQSENDTLIERLEVSEPRAVIQHQDGHDLAIGQPGPWPALLCRLPPLRQQLSFPRRVKRLAEIIELTEIFHEPVEHRRLPTSDGADSRRGMQGRQGLRVHPKPVTRVILNESSGDPVEAESLIEMPTLRTMDFARQMRDLLMVLLGSLEQLRGQPLDQHGRHQLARAEVAVERAADLLRIRREISDPPTPRFQAMPRHNFG